MSAEQEREIGAQEAKKIERAMGFVDDPELTAYVTRIGERLAKHSPWQEVVYTFHVVEMAEPNAFALPGGFIYVTRGLLALSNSEDELAGVIGHEIGHVAARHAVQRISKAVPLMPIAIVTGIAGAATSIVSPSLGGVLSGSGILAVQAALAPYSRSQENEADEVGQELAAKAGYDPAGITRFFRTLDREVTYLLGQERKPGFLDTHPATPERVAKTAERAEKLTRAEGPSPFAPTRAQFLEQLDGLLVGRDPAQGLFDGDVFIQPQLRFSMEFPSAWKTQNTPTLVAAVEPGENAFMTLQIAGEGNDPVKVARAFAQEVEPRLAETVTPTRIGGLRAARGETQMRGHGFDFTWIAHRGLVYMITGVSESRRFDSYRGAFRASSESFRPLSSARLAQVKENRLRTRSCAQRRDGAAAREAHGHVLEPREDGAVQRRRRRREAGTRVPHEGGDPAALRSTRTLSATRGAASRRCARSIPRWRSAGPLRTVSTW